MTTNNKLFSIYYGVRVLAQRVKRLPAKQETWVRSLGQEDPLEKEMATHSSILAWKIPWTEKPGRLQSVGSQRVRHDWVTSLSLSWGQGVVLNLFHVLLLKLTEVDSTIIAPFSSWGNIKQLPRVPQPICLDPRFKPNSIYPFPGMENLGGEIRHPNGNDC